MSEHKTANSGAEYFGTVGVAMVTPFDRHGELDIKAGRALAAHLVDEGVDALILAGTTGESPTTTTAEKLALLSAVKEEVGGRARLVAGVGTYNTAETVRRAKASRDAGADALLVVTPYYSKPSQEGLRQHFTTVAQATDLPICLYDIPGRSGVPIAPETIRELAAIPSIRAVKDAKGNLAASTPLIQETGLAWYSGDDSLNVPWLSLGAVGFISVIGHVAARQLREMYDGFVAGDLTRARTVNARLVPLMSAQARLGGVTLAKAALRLQGIDVGDPRLPIIAANDDEVELLRRDMENSGVL